MPAKWTWTAEQDALIREMDAAGLMPKDMAQRLGCGVQLARRHARVLGIANPRAPVAQRLPPTRSKYYETPPYPRTMDPLPAGHPETWRLLMALTPCLEGSEYPHRTFEP